MSRVDAAAGSTITIGQVGTRPSDVAAAGGLVWVADRHSNTVSLLDARSGELQEQVDLHAAALAAGHGAMWAADDLYDVVRRLDPRTGAELDVIELPEGSGASDVQTGEGAVWVAAGRAGKVLRVDPASGATSSLAIDIPGVERLSASGPDLWAVSPSEDAATRIDASTSRVAVRAAVCDSPVAVAAVPDGGGAWVACGTERALWHVDPAGTVDRTVTLDAVPTDVVLDGERAGVTLRED